METLLPTIAAVCCGIALLYVVVARTMRRRAEENDIVSRMETPKVVGGTATAKKAA